MKNKNIYQKYQLTRQNEVASGNIAAATPFSSILESFCNVRWKDIIHFSTLKSKSVHIKDVWCQLKQSLLYRQTNDKVITVVLCFTLTTNMEISLSNVLWLNA